MTRGARHWRFSSLRTQQALGRALVAPALDQHVEHHAGLVDRAPEPVLHTGDLDGDFVEVPLVPGAGQAPTDPVGELLAELERPLPPIGPLRGPTVADDDAPRAMPGTG
jgi:hypothetical protein